MSLDGVPIGLDSLYYAELTSDASGGVVYGTPVQMTGAIEVGINPNAAAATLYADDGPMITSTTLGEIQMTLNVADIPLDVQATLLGHTVTDGVLTRLSTATPIWCAVGFKALKSNGNYRYTWLLKGKFMEPELNAQTKADSVNFQTKTIVGNFVKREYDDAWIRQTDEDLTGYTADLGANWFTDPDYTAP